MRRVDVTIALPVYNGAETLQVAVESIIRQSFYHWELIILDDASTDHSVEVMRTFEDPRIRLLEGDKNIGLSARLNMAVSMAKGHYFARMDQDDISFPERIEKQLAYLNMHPNVDLLATSVIVFKGNEALTKVEVKQEHADICATPWNGFYMPHPTWMGKTDWFKRHVYQSFADGAEDSHLLFRTYQNSKFAGLNMPLLGYRQEERKLKTLFSRRSIVLRVLAREAIVNRDYVLAFQVIVVQLLKMLGDVFHTLFGWACMRYTSTTLTQREYKAWNDLLHDLSLDRNF